MKGLAPDEDWRERERGRERKSWGMTIPNWVIVLGRDKSSDMLGLLHLKNDVFFFLFVKATLPCCCQCHRQCVSFVSLHIHICMYL